MELNYCVFGGKPEGETRSDLYFLRIQNLVTGAVTFTGSTYHKHTCSSHGLSFCVPVVVWLLKLSTLNVKGRSEPDTGNIIPEHKRENEFVNGLIICQICFGLPKMPVIMV